MENPIRLDDLGVAHGTGESTEYYHRVILEFLENMEKSGRINRNIFEHSIVLSTSVYIYK